ncbi:hypothetical protein DPMN_044928 [Dreissena polymorpha]|uniref:Uncharacterized protein n=1 Tax=Dreissena polymorpha TaxID=45954 RepID=A0A9D4HWV7_DREPO|nr:hypothetical protein DPMN_044928 [Dreissena polymorpha]
MKSTKALPKYGSGRTDGNTDGQHQNNIPQPMAGDIKKHTSKVEIELPTSKSNGKTMSIITRYYWDKSSKFHEDQKINVASIVLTRKNAPPPGGHVFQPTSIIFELVQDIIGMNLLTKFHEDQTINVASRVKIAPPLGSHISLLTRKNAPPPIIFELVQDIIGMNRLTEFHEDQTINVASREKCPAPWQPCFSSKHNLLTKFHEDWTINVASRVLTRKNAPAPGGHVFQPPSIIFELIQDIIGMNLLTKFHEDQTINVASRVLTRKNAPPNYGHFYEDQTKNVASRVKNAPPLGSHVFQANVTIFELIQDIIENNILTKFHEDWTINVPSRELTRQMLTPHYSQRTTDDGQKAITKAHHEHVVLRGAKKTLHSIN